MNQEQEDEYAMQKVKSANRASVPRAGSPMRSSRMSLNSSPTRSIKRTVPKGSIDLVSGNESIDQKNKFEGNNINSDAMASKHIARERARAYD